MKFNIKHQESFSRGKLLLRTFFGVFYILIPHAFILFFVGIWYVIQDILLPWVILFTGNMPESWYKFRAGYIFWGLRVNASMFNLMDEYPAFGVKGTSETIEFSMERPEKLSRLLNFLTFIKALALIPHLIVIPFIGIAAMFVYFIAWWVVLFSGKYPEGMHRFVTGYFRWMQRINNYMNFMTDKYPPFSTKESEETITVKTEA